MNKIRPGRSSILHLAGSPENFAGNFETVCNVSRYEISKQPEFKPEHSEVDVGFVFAMPMEAAGIVDRLKESKTTKGDGRTFHAGRFDANRVVIVESGVGREKAGRAAEVLIDVFQPKRVVSAGYAGALSRRLERFATCFPELVVREFDGAALDLSGPIPRTISASSEPVQDRLVLLTTDFVVDTPEFKQALGRRTGAEIVDMETFAVAEVCGRLAVPFLAVRIVLDTAGEQLPDDIRRMMKSAERSRTRLVGSVLGSLFRRPSVLFDLYSLKERALAATDRLAERLAAELRDRKG